MARHRNGTFVVAITAAAVLVATEAAVAAPGTLVRTVPASLEFRDGDYAVNGVPHCGSATFVRWTAVPGTTSATAAFRARSSVAADRGEPFEAREVTRPAENGAQGPFDASYAFGVIYRVEPGYHWININQVAGGSATCADGAARQRRMVDTGAGVNVTLKIAVAAPVVRSVRATQRLDSRRRATVGTVACPANGACTVRVPRTTRVRINGKRYALAVTVPARLAAGQRADVRVRFPRSAAAALSRRSVRPVVAVTATNHGVATTTARVKSRVRR